MAVSQSGRPETSYPTTSSPTGSIVAPDLFTSASQADTDGLYVPHLFDFIYFTSQVANRVNPLVPAIFLETQAVDNSILIGHGASFSASKMDIEEVPGQQVISNALEGVSITSTTPSRPAQTIVYKTARIAFTPTGEPVQRDKRAMSSAMMEIYALVHPPLRRHENVVKLLGLAWGSNPFEPAHRLPVPIVEYADMGTLYDLQKNETLNSEQKRRLCLDTTLGINALHNAGLVHGDVKSENVLVFSHNQGDRKYIAKIADFGFSVVEAASGPSVHLGGTRPWLAPEATAPVPQSQLKATDIYSLGLLVLRVAQDGKNPFPTLLAGSSNINDLAEQIECLKQADEMRSQARLERWYTLHFIEIVKASETTLNADVDLVAKLTELQISAASSQETGERSLPQDPSFLLRQIIATLIARGADLEIWNDILLKYARADPFLKRIDTIVEHSLGKDSGTRNLNAVIEALKLPSEELPSSAGNQVLQRSFDHHLLSWEMMRHLQPSVQPWIFDVFETNRTTAWQQNQMNPPQYFLLASFYINGYGTPVDYEQAKRLINLAAINGHEPSQAYAYRIWSALTPEFVATPGVKLQLEVMAFKGSRTALLDLQQVDLEKANQVSVQLKSALAGTGANFFFKNMMLHGLWHWPWQDMLQSRESIAEKLGRVRDKSNYKVNQRGDRIIHIAAASGWTEAVTALIDTYNVDVNLKNDCNETPLLCACRSGHVATVHALIELGAEANLVTHRNESPLHWLISSDPSDTEEIGNYLIGAGADVALQTTEDIAYSVFRAGIEVDHQRAGSALAWAVHRNRPDIVKFLLSASSAKCCLEEPPSHGMSPLEWAAHFHHHECLEPMIEALDLEKITFTYGNLIKRTICSADAFAMILRHGNTFKDHMRSTLDLYIRRCKKIAFSGGAGIKGGDSTALFLAVSRLSDLAVEYLLSSEVAVHSSPKPVHGVFHPDHINLPIGPRQMTPLLEAVRLHRLHIIRLLLDHGADMFATSNNPYYPKQKNWTALHTFAHAAHDSQHVSKTLEILIDSVPGIPVDGRPKDTTEPETPLSSALGACALNLATKLLEKGADINAISLNGGLIASSRPMTLLGHAVASTSRSALFRLRWLLSKIDLESSFVVESERMLTALHRAAMAHLEMGFLEPNKGTARAIQWQDVDWETNRAVLTELLIKYAEASFTLRQDCDGKTALHWAVIAGNLDAVELLLQRQRQLSTIEDSRGKTPHGTAIQAAHEAATVAGKSEISVRTKITHLLAF